MRYFVTIEDEVLEVEIDGGRVTLNGAPVAAEMLCAGSSAVRSMRLGHRSHTVVTGNGKGDDRVLFLDGRRVALTVVDERTRRIREMSGAAGGAAGPRPLKAPMPGLVVKVEVEEGQAVTEGQGLVIVEAMKMENELKADSDALVAHVLVEEGQAVEKDQVLIDFAVEDHGEGEGSP